MKKYLKVLAIFIFAIMLVGCGSYSKTDTKTDTKNVDKPIKTCTLSVNDTQSNYQLSSKYNVYGKDDVVTKVSTVEEITSDSEELLNYFKATSELTYKSADERYGGYTYKVEINGKKLTSTTTIDYNKMDLEAFVNDNSELAEYVNSDNKITVEGITKLYEDMGAKCE